MFFFSRISSPAKEAEKEEKLRLVEAKRAAAIDIILSCSVKLHHVKAKGSPDDHHKLVEQQDAVEVWFDMEIDCCSVVVF